MKKKTQDSFGSKLRSRYRSFFVPRYFLILIEAQYNPLSIFFLIMKGNEYVRSFLKLGEIRITHFNTYLENHAKKRISNNTPK